MTSAMVSVLTLTLSLPAALAHVSLTFPPARNYPLDFLDSVRTKGPCGMPKGKLLLHVSDCFSINTSFCNFSFIHNIQLRDSKKSSVKFLVISLFDNFFILMAWKRDRIE